MIIQFERAYKMYKKAVIFCLLCIPGLGNSAEAILVGEGEVLSSPDYVTLSIIVDSKCYPTPAEARKVNDDAARKIVDFLNTKIKNKDAYNTVVSNGGYTSAYQTYYKDKMLCQNTFQKQITIIFKTQDLKEFESLFNEIQTMVYKQFSSNAPAVVDAAISYVSMSDPLPGITTEFRSKLEQKALALAFADAKAKLYSLFDKNGIQNLKMTYATEISPDEAKPLLQSRAAVPMAMMATNKMEKRAPVQFEEQTINKTIFFKFTFDDIPLQAQ